MKKVKLFIVTFVTISVLGLTSCDNNDEVNNGSGNSTKEFELVGEMTQSRTLDDSNIYILKGGFTVKSPAILTIKAGTKINAAVSDDPTYLLIEKGAKIVAQGTALKPIVFSAEKKEHGAWGGIHICGDAPINLSLGTGESEIGGASYGGNNVSDNSGVLKYVRVEYAGQKLDETHEGNGFSFYGVGNGTSCEYLQAYRGDDDGYEFFGGTVNIKYCVSTSNSDDSFDWTQGWRGKAQFLVAYQASAEKLGYACDRLMECDNLEDNESNTPISHPVLSNVTFVSENNSEHTKGITLRRGTEVELYNAIVTGKDQCLTVEQDHTETALKDDISTMKYVLLSNEVNSKQDIFNNDEFLTKIGCKSDYINALSDKFIGTEESDFDASTLDSDFFSSAKYAGAVKKDNNWMNGWTK